MHMFELFSAFCNIETMAHEKFMFYTNRDNFTTGEERTIEQFRQTRARSLTHSNYDNRATFGPEFRGSVLYPTICR